MIVLSPKDVKLIQGLLDESRRKVGVRSRTQEIDWPSPDTYLCYASSTIPAAAGSTGTGSGAVLFPGSNLCSVFKLMDSGTLSSIGLDILVYNYSRTDIPADRWLLATRDKLGTWYATATVDGDDVSTGSITVTRDNSATPSEAAGPISSTSIYVFRKSGISLGTDGGTHQGLEVIAASPTQQGAVSTASQAFRGTKGFIIFAGSSELFVITGNSSFDPANPETTYDPGYRFNPAGVSGIPIGLQYKNSTLSLVTSYAPGTGGGAGWSIESNFTDTTEFIGSRVDGGNFVIWHTTAGVYQNVAYAVQGPGSTQYTGIWDNSTVPGLEVKGGLIISLTLSSLATAVNGQLQGLSCSGLPSTGGVTSGTAFQPSATNASTCTITATLTSVLTLIGNVAVAISSTIGGSYTTVANMTAMTLAGSFGAQTVNVTICVPLGWYVKVTAGAGIAASTALSQTSYT